MLSTRSRSVAAALLFGGALAAQWQSLPPLPMQPGPVQAFAFGDRAVVFGGPWYHDVEGWRVARLGPERTWRTLPAPPLSPREAMVVHAVGGRLVVWGGHERRTERTCTDGAVLDPATGTWRVMPAAPIAGRVRPGVAVAADGARLVLVGGGAGAEHFADGAVFDVAAHRWHVLPALPIAGRMEPSVVFAGERIVVHGGMRIDGGRVQACNDGAVLEPGATVWTLLPAAPLHCSERGVCAADGERVTCFVRKSGWLANGAVLDLAAKRWSSLPPRDDFGISPGVAHAAAGNVFVYSGRMGAGDLEHDAWSWRSGAQWHRVDLPLQLRPREQPGVARDGARLAVVGGGRTTAVAVSHGPQPAQPELGNLYGDGFVADLATGAVHHVTAGPLSSLAPAVVFFGDGLLVVGGHDAKEKHTVAAATFRLP